MFVANEHGPSGSVIQGGRTVHRIGGFMQLFGAGAAAGTVQILTP